MAAILRAALLIGQRIGGLRALELLECLLCAALACGGDGGRDQSLRLLFEAFEQRSDELASESGELLARFAERFQYAELAFEGLAFSRRHALDALHDVQRELRCRVAGFHQCGSIESEHGDRRRPDAEPPRDPRGGERSDERTGRSDGEDDADHAGVPAVASEHQGAVVRLQGRFDLVDGVAWVRDLGSTNGTFLNGAPVPHERPLQDGEPTHWLVYFTVASCDEALATIAEAGGSVIAGPLDTAMGRVAAVSDPQGAAFALFEGQVDP